MAGKFSMKITGAKEVSENIRSRVIPAIRNNVAAALNQWGEEVMTRSKQVVPVDTGNLMGTGHVEMSASAENVGIRLLYGGPAANYAYQVHERTRPTRWSRPGSGPKYLENPINEKLPVLPARILAAVKSAL